MVERVVIIEDQDLYIDAVEGLLEEAGHKVVASYKSKQTAKKAIPNFGRKKVGFVALDANLGPGAEGGKDGDEVLLLLRKKAPQIIVIGIGSDHIKGVNFNLTKSNIALIADTINTLSKERDKKSKK